MGILRDFDYVHDGFSFANFDTATLDWDTYRRSFLSIWPTDDLVAAPLDVAFYEAAFKGCAAPGHCVGMSTLALTIWQLGGWFGFSSPADFYAAPPDTYPHPGPDSDDLRNALHIVHARQFGAGNVQDVLQTAKAGHLNDAGAAFDRVRDGLASGDLQVISIADKLIDGAPHALLPYRCETLTSGARELYVWDSVRSFAIDPQYYLDGHNKIQVNSNDPTDWTYDQNGGGLSGGHLYQGANHGWLFAFAASAVRSKASQPFSVGYALSELSYLVLTGSASVDQIEDAEGRGLITTDADGQRGLEGAALPIAPWPWAGGTGSEMYLIDGSAWPVTVSVTGGDYRLRVASSGHLTEIVPHDTLPATDSIRYAPEGDTRTVELRSTSADRRFDVRHVRALGEGAWHGVSVRGAPAGMDALRVRIEGTGDVAHVSGATAQRYVDVEFERFRDGSLTASTLPERSIDLDRPLAAAPEEWRTVPRDAPMTG